LWLLVDGTVEVTKTEDGKPYLEVNAVNSYGVEVHIVYDGTTTSLEDIDRPTDNTCKVLRNGQLLIIREGKTYNMVGTEM
jgi:PHP family Zn ribbon phosphoesterase